MAKKAKKKVRLRFAALADADLRHLRTKDGRALTKAHLTDRTVRKPILRKSDGKPFRVDILESISG